jgi:hypothetical protein
MAKKRIVKGRDYRTSKNRDGLRAAKHVGYRFSGGSKRRPTSAEVQEFHDGKRDDIYYENRIERSDAKPRAKRGQRFAKGGGFDVKVNKIKKLLKKNNVKSDEVSPNFVNDFAHKNGVTDLTSEQVVRISDTYAKGGSMKQSKAGIKQDKNVKAKKAGKRTSADGNVYYESRPNRSDKNRTKKLAKGGGVKQSKAGIVQDKNIKALKAGKRESADGNIYYENRPNRSDVSRTKKLVKGGGVDEVEWVVELSNPQTEKIRKIEVKAKTRDEAIDNALKTNNFKGYNIFTANRKIRFYLFNAKNGIITIKNKSKNLEELESYVKKHWSKISTGTIWDNAKFYEIEGTRNDITGWVFSNDDENENDVIKRLSSQYDFQKHEPKKTDSKFVKGGGVGKHKKYSDYGEYWNAVVDYIYKENKGKISKEIIEKEANNGNIDSLLQNMFNEGDFDLSTASYVVMDDYFNMKKGGSVGSQEKEVREILNSNGEISCGELEGIIGHEPCYPVCKVGGMTLRKKFMCGYKEI